MSKSRDNRRRRLRQARNYQQQLQQRAVRADIGLKKKTAQLTFAMANLKAFQRALGGPKVYLAPKIVEERDYQTGNIVRGVELRFLRWDGFRMTLVDEFHIRFETDRQLEQFERDPEGILKFRWRNAGSELGVKMVEWLRGQKPVDTPLTPSVLRGSIHGPANPGRQPTNEKR